MEHTTKTDIVYEETKYDETIPEGWKSAKYPDNSLPSVFWDSNMNFFSSRAEAVRVMVGDKKKYKAKEIETMKKGLFNEGWQKHIGLPEGWMYRASVILVSSWDKSFIDQQFLSPEFEMIRNSKCVLNRLVKSSTYKSESVYSKFVLNFCLDVEKDKIDSFEWIEAPHNLRLGKFFLKSDVDEFIQIVLTKDGRLFRNQSDDFLEDVRFDNEYLPDEKEEISDLLSKHFSVKPHEKIPSVKSSNKCFASNVKKNTNEWVDDPNLPLGWKYRLKNFAAKSDSKRKMFKAPNGNILRARLQAVEYLMEIKATQEDINKMKSGLIEEEDWTWDARIPDNWLLKYREKGDSTHGCYFMNAEGEVLKNYQQAYRDLVEKGYDKKFLSKLQTFYKSRKGIVSTGGDSTNEKIREIVNNENNLPDPLDTSVSQVQKLSFSDELERSLPAGWKSVLITGGMKQRKFEAPDGKEIIGVLEALKYMTFALVTPQADIDTVKSVLAKQEGWKTDPKIPKGWLVKKLEVYTHFLTKEHDVLYGHGAAWKYMRDKDYPDEEISEFRKNFNPKPVQGKCDKLQETIDKSEDLAIPPGQTSSNKIKNLPAGWKFLDKYIDSHRAMYFNVFISPQGNVYRSLLKVLNIMVSMKYSVMDIATMKSNLLDEGWKMDENLPVGWLFKKMDHRIYYLSDKFETIRGLKNAVKHLEDNKFSTLQVERISWCGKKKKEELKPTAVVKEETLEHENPLPDGWMFVDGKLRNTDGVMFQTIREAVEHLVTHDTDPKVVYSLWNTLHLEGWVLGPSLLPMGWRIKFVGSDSHFGYQILTREMCVLREEQEVVEYLKENEDYSLDNIRNFKEWVYSLHVKKDPESQNVNSPKRRKFA